MTRYIFSFFMFLGLGAFAQEPLSYSRFMEMVSQKNALYLAEKYNVDIAVANAQAAAVFNDPELSVEYGNNQDWSIQMGQSLDVGLGYTFSLGNVRGARMQVAGTELAISEQAVADYFCGLKAEAAQAYAEAWACSRMADLMEESYNNMDRIARSDSLRLSTGDLSMTDAMQSRLEARAMHNDYLAARNEYANSLVALSTFIGGDRVLSVSQNITALAAVPADSPVGVLVDMAKENRSDLRAAELGKRLSADNLRLVQASRAMEIGLGLGYSYNTEVRNEIAPAPMFHGLSFGVTIPLKFSSINRGEKVAAQRAVDQSHKAYEAAVQQIEAEVIQAYNSWQTAGEILGSYDSSILTDAAMVLENRTIGYRSGNSGLLELLAAQAAYNEIMSAYIDACKNAFIASAMLNRSLGL